MKGLKGYGKIVPAAPSTSEGKRRTTRVRIFAVCFSITVAVVICLVAGSIHLRNKESRSGAGKGLKTSYVIETACNKAFYRRVCISTLSSHTEALRANLSELSRVAVELSIIEAKHVSRYIEELGRRAAGKREIGALEDCIQQLQDTVEQLNSSLSELARLSSNSLKKQTSDVQTWLSAALTNPSTCLDGLEDVGVDSNVKAVVRAKSENMTQLISNALAVVQSLSTGGDITNDHKISVRNRRRLLFEAGDFPSLGFYSPCHAQ